MAYTDFAGKWLEMLGELVPRGSSVGNLHNANNADVRTRVNAMIASGPAAGLTVRPFAATTPAEVDAQLSATAKARVRAVIVDPDGVLRAKRTETVEALARARVPVMYSARDYVDAGGLMSYGPSREETARRAAWYVDRILKGARPADLPVEQPTRLELIVNLRAARASGIVIPRSLLQRADDVLE